MGLLYFRCNPLESSVSRFISASGKVQQLHDASLALQSYSVKRYVFGATSLSVTIAAGFGFTEFSAPSFFRALTFSVVFLFLLRLRLPGVFSSLLFLPKSSDLCELGNNSEGATAVSKAIPAAVRHFVVGFGRCASRVQVLRRNYVPGQTTQTGL